MRNRRLLIISLMALGLIVMVVFGLRTQFTLAFWNINPPDQPGFPQTLSGANISESAAKLVDLDGDPNTLEIVLGGRDRSGGTLLNSGKVYAYRSNGQLYWETAVRAPIQGALAVADIDTDGVPEVLAPLGGYVDSMSWNGGLVALDGRTGAIKWTFDTDDWLWHVLDGYSDGVYSSPAVGDLDADGDLEIVFGAWDQCVYALDHNGDPIWPELNGLVNQTHCGGHGFYNEDTIWSSPALADVTNDGKLEIIIGADISAGNVFGDPTGGYMYVLSADGDMLAREWLNQTIYSSPAVTDLEGDGQLEIVVGSGLYVPDTGYWVKVFNYDGTTSLVTDRLVTRYTLPTGGRVFASPAIADLDNDGYQDIVAIANIGDGSEQGGPNLGSRVLAWSGVNGAQMFSTPACDLFNNSKTTHSSPVIAEVGRSGDTGLKILFSQGWEVSILNADGSYYTDPGSDFTSATNYCAGYSHTTDLTYYANYTMAATPAVGDIDGDGKVEVVVGGGYDANNPNVGRLYVWKPGRDAGALPWPQFRYNAYSSGNSVAPELEVSTTNLDIPYEVVQQAGTNSFAVQNGAPGSVLTWEATVDWDGGPVWFDLDKIEGVTSVIDTVNINIRSSYTDQKGVYTATIHLTCVEGCGDNTDADIAVSFEVPPESLSVPLNDPVMWVSTTGDTIQTLSLPVVNDGAAGRITWEASSNANWLTVTPENACTDTASVVTLTADRTNLSDGTHYATVTIKALTPDDVDNAVQNVVVDVKVGDFSFVYLPSAVK